MRQKLILFLITLLVGAGIQAQDSKFSATLSYPLPVGDNFVAKNYTGVVDLGLQYRFVKTGIVNLGISANFSYLTFENTSFDPSVRVNGTFLAPRVFVELNAPGLQKLRPSLGVGYAFTNFTTKDQELITTPIPDENEGGFTFNLGGTYDFGDRFFALIYFDFITTSRVDEIADDNFNTRINVLRFGGGIRF